MLTEEAFRYLDGSDVVRKVDEAAVSLVKVATLVLRQLVLLKFNRLFWVWYSKRVVSRR